MTKSYKKYFKFNCSPEYLYRALTDKNTIEIWTGEKADFKHENNTEFSMWDESICGQNVLFEENKSISQIWYFEEGESSVKIKLHSDKNSTSMEVKQDNIPSEYYFEVCDIWEEGYYSGLAEMFNE